MLALEKVYSTTFREHFATRAEYDKVKNWFSTHANSKERVVWLGYTIANDLSKLILSSLSLRA